MSGPARRPTYSGPVQEAVQWFIDNRVQSCAGSLVKHFIPVQSARKHFDYTRLLTILERVLPDGSDYGRLANSILNHDADRCLDGDPGEGYLLVFFVLLHIHKAQDIENFLHDDALSDKNLPFGSDKHLPHGVDSKEFYREQQPFSAPLFRPSMEKHFAEGRVLPIESKELIANGDNAVIYRIKLHAEYDRLESETPDNTHIYVIKSFRGPIGQRLFNAEVKGYHQTRRTGKLIDSLTRCYGNYTYVDEYNVILEYADVGTWEHFMQKQFPPSRPRDIAALWDSLLALAQVLNRIHVAFGMHQDINPTNLLVKSNPLGNDYTCCIKLADFGRSFFDSGAMRDRGLLIKDMYGGAKEFGAPACYRPDRYTQNTVRYIPQTADVWSLGCVWSEAVVWMSGGWSAVLGYRDSRRKEATEMHMEDLAYFHDGTSMLDCVKEVLQSTGRKANTDKDLNAIVCQDIVQYMLQQDAVQTSGSRQVTSDELLRKIQQISRTTQNQRHSSADDAIHPPDIKGLGIRRTETAPEPSGPSTTQRHIFKAAFPMDSSGLHAGAEVGTPRTMTIENSDDHSRPYPTRPQVSDSPSRKQKRMHSGRRSNGNGLPFRREGNSIDEEYESEELLPGGQDAGVTLPRQAFGDTVPDRGHFQHAAGSSSQSNSTAAAGSPTHTRYDSHVSKGASVVHTQSPPTRQALPNVEPTAAMNWMNQKMRGNANAYLEYSAELKGKLKERDHVFIIDDSYSTAKHWPSICGILEVLSFIVEKDDPDGVELYFANSTESIRSTKSSHLTDLASTVMPRGDTTLEPVLARVLEEHKEKLHQHADKVSRGKHSDPIRPLSIYILTDGVWYRGGDPVVPLLGLVQTLKELNLTRNQVGIQFISFGNDVGGLQRMHELDEMSKGFELEKDIVDTEPSKGNVWKMLLGAIDDDFDDD